MQWLAHQTVLECWRGFTQPNEGCSRTSQVISHINSEVGGRVGERLCVHSRSASWGKRSAQSAAASAKAARRAARGQAPPVGCPAQARRSPEKHGSAKGRLEADTTLRPSADLI